jgi:hypothetical protein
MTMLGRRRKCLRIRSENGSFTYLISTRPEPVYCGAVEGPSRSKPGSTFAFANRIVLVRV